MLLVTEPVLLVKRLKSGQCPPPPSYTISLSPCLCRIGTAGIAVQVVGSNWPKPHYTLLITGLCRFSVSSLLKERPFVLAEVRLSLELILDV